MPFSISAKEKNEMTKTIICPKCGRVLGSYDGRSTINKIIDCRKCRKRVIYHIDTGEIEIKAIPERKTSSGVQF